VAQSEVNYPVWSPHISSTSMASRQPCATLLVESAITSSIGVTTSGPFHCAPTTRGMRTPLQAFFAYAAFFVREYRYPESLPGRAYWPSVPSVPVALSRSITSRRAVCRRQYWSHAFFHPAWSINVFNSNTTSPPPMMVARLSVPTCSSSAYSLPVLGSYPYSWFGPVRKPNGMAAMESIPATILSRHLVSKTGDRRNVFQFVKRKPENVPSVPGFSRVLQGFSSHNLHNSKPENVPSVHGFVVPGFVRFVPGLALPLPLAGFLASPRGFRARIHVRLQRHWSLVPDPA